VQELRFRKLHDQNFDPWKFRPWKFEV